MRIAQARLHRASWRVKTASAVVASAAAVALVLSGCSAGGQASASGSASQTTRGGTLTILASSSDINFDPAQSQSLAITSLGLVHRRLTAWKVEHGKPTQVVPDLATTTGTSSDGGRVWTYTLKSGLKFSNGKPITSADIKYGLERSFAPELSGGLSYHKTLLEGGSSYKGPFNGKQLDSIETPNARTIIFHLNKPYGDWPWVASTAAFAPVPKADDDLKNYGKKPISSGPYVVQSNTSGSGAVLVRNKFWNNDTVRTAGPNKIVWKLGQDPSVSAQSIAAGSGDAANSFSSDFVPPAQITQISNNPQEKNLLLTSGPGALAYLAFNTQRPALKNVKVRQALEYAVDKNSYLLASGGKISGSIATTLITPGIPGRRVYDLYKAPATGDVAKAKSLLQAAGVSNLKLNLSVANDATSLAQAQAIQAGLKRAGVTVTLKPEDPNTFYTTITANKVNYDLVLSSWQPDYPSANGNISPLFGSDQIGGGNFNLSRFSDPQVDKLIAQAQGTVDQTAAGKIWAQADRAILEQAPVVPLIYTKNTFIRGANVKNFVIGEFPAYPNYLTVSVSK